MPSKTGTDGDRIADEHPLNGNTVELHSVASGKDTLIPSIKSYVQEYMSGYDASHDFNHILRVLALSKRILDSESQLDPSKSYDPQIVTLAVLLHDVGDKKYAVPGVDVENQIRDVLLERGAPADLANKVQMIGKNVSFSLEIKDPDRTRAVIAQHPELAIVQDADRLDAIGAIGIGRTFTFGGAKRPQDGMQGTIDHFTKKLELLEGMMKTETGRLIAKGRTERLRVFKLWWEEETAVP